MTYVARQIRIRPWRRFTANQNCAADSAEDLAAMLAISPTTLRRLEQGAPPTAAIAALFNLLDELGIELHLCTPSDIGPLSLPSVQQPPVRTRVKA